MYDGIKKKKTLPYREDTLRNLDSHFENRQKSVVFEVTIDVNVLFCSTRPWMTIVAFIFHLFSCTKQAHEAKNSNVNLSKISVGFTPHDQEI